LRSDYEDDPEFGDLPPVFRALQVGRWRSSWRLSFYVQSYLYLHTQLVKNGCTYCERVTGDGSS
jgi:hypothetical protein